MKNVTMMKSTALRGILTLICCGLLAPTASADHKGKDKEKDQAEELAKCIEKLDKDVVKACEKMAKEVDKGIEEYAKDIEKYNKELAKATEERHLEHAEKHLEKAQEALDDANEEYDEAVAKIDKELLKLDEKLAKDLAKCLETAEEEGFDDSFEASVTNAFFSASFRVRRCVVDETARLDEIYPQ